MKKMITKLITLTIVFLLCLTTNIRVRAAHVSGCSDTSVIYKYTATGSTSTHDVDVYCASCDGWLWTSSESHSWGNWYYENESIHKRQCTKCNGTISRAHGDENGDSKCDTCNGTMPVTDTAAPTIEQVPAAQVYNEEGKAVTFSIYVSDSSGIDTSKTTWYVYAGETLYGMDTGTSTYDSSTHKLSFSMTLPSGSGWTGNCTFNARPVIYDGAGNYIDIRNDTSKQIQIIIDTTAPTIEQVPAAQVYKDAGKTVTFSIKVYDANGIDTTRTTWHIYAGERLWSTSGGSAYDSSTHILTKTVTLPSDSEGWEGNCMYNARPVIFDKAGNYVDIRNDTSKQIQIRIDNVAPTYSSFTVTPTVTNQKTITATIAASDNYLMNRVSFAAWFYDSGGGAYRTSPVSTSESNGTYTATFNIDKIVNQTTNVASGSEGTYYVDAWVYDAAGNSTYVSAKSVKYDITAPTGNNLRLSATQTNQSTVTVSLDAADNFSGVKSVMFCSWYGTYSESFSSKTVTTGSDGVYSTTFNINEIVNSADNKAYGYDGKYYFNAWVYDNAGNSTLTSMVNLTYDKTAPTAPTFVIKYIDDDTTHTNGNWTNRKIYTQISSTDATGVAKIQFSQDKKTWNDFTFDVSNGLTNSGTTYTGKESWNLEERKEDYYFRAIDAIGNISSESQVFYLRYDLTAPTIEQVPTKQIYNEAGKAVTFSIKVSDTAGINTTKTTWHIYAGERLYGTTTGTSTYDSSTHMLSFSMTLPDDSNGWEGNCTYNARPVIYDGAGNYIDIRNDTSKQVQIVIDTTAPTIEQVPTVQVYKDAGKTVTFSIKVYDANGIDTTKTTWHIYAGESLWSTSGASVYDSSTHMLTKTVTLPSDSAGWEGNCMYNARPVIYDNAGNYVDIRNDTSKQIQIRIDNVAPTYSSFTVTPTLTNQKTITASIAASDNYLMDRVSFAAWFYDNGGGAYRTSPVSTTESNGIYTATFNIDKIVNQTTNVASGSDGTYYVDVWVYDAAGNSTYVSAKSVKYDTTAPTGNIGIDVNYENNGYKYVDSNTVDISLTATDNTSVASELKIAILNEDDFYTITSDSELEWKNYSETIDWQTTEGDGLKKIYIIIKDKVGNQSLYFTN